MRATYGGTYGNDNSGPHLNAPLYPKSLMLIETWALHLAELFFEETFIEYVAQAIHVQEVTKIDDFISIGTTLHKVADTKGFLIHLPCVFFHLPQTDVRLFSPQAHHQ
jgi:hypothetical protein